MEHNAATAVPKAGPIRGLTNVNEKLSIQNEQVQAQTASITILRHQFCIAGFALLFFLVCTLGLLVATIYITDSISHDSGIVTTLDGEPLINGPVIEEVIDSSTASKIARTERASTASRQELVVSEGIALYQSMEVNEVMIINETMCAHATGVSQCGTSIDLTDSGHFLAHISNWTTSHLTNFDKMGSELVKISIHEPDGSWKDVLYILRGDGLIVTVSDGCRTISFKGTPERINLFNTNTVYQDNLYAAIQVVFAKMECGTIMKVLGSLTSGE